MARFALGLSACFLCAAACSPAEDAATTGGSSTTAGSGGSSGSRRSRGSPLPPADPFDVPIDGVSAEQQKAFFPGDDLFGLPLHDADGLGPLYTRTSCGACHADGIRGPGTVQKMSVVLADGFTTSPDQSLLPF